MGLEGHMTQFIDKSKKQINYSASTGGVTNFFSHRAEPVNLALKNFQQAIATDPRSQKTSGPKNPGT